MACRCGVWVSRRPLRRLALRRGAATRMTMSDREQKAVAACKAVLEAFQYFSLCDEQEDGLDEEGGTKFGYVMAEAAEERLVKQLTEAVEAGART